MRIVFHPKFYESNYIDDGSSIMGRMEAIIDVLKLNKNYDFYEPKTADIQDVLLAHSESYIEKVKINEKLFKMAMLSVGSAISAGEFACNGIVSMSINRPPGHHAYKDMGWGYCHFNNMAISLLSLLKAKKIKSAFLLDFDAHTGDGTKDILKDYNNIKVFNPMAETPEEYIVIIEKYVKDLSPVDVIAVSAGFDNYEKDLGKKLRTFDFYTIGYILKKLSKRFNNAPRFAVLEGGYYLPDLGKNVAAFCEGFE